MAKQQVLTKEAWNRLSNYVNDLFIGRKIVVVLTLNEFGELVEGTTGKKLTHIEEVSDALRAECYIEMKKEIRELKTEVHRLSLINK